MNNFCSSICNKNTGLLILRIAIGAVFLAHGIAKLSGMDGTIMFFASLGLPAFIAWAVAIVETLGGAAVLLGIWTRVAAIGLVIVMIGAITTAKWGKPFLGGYEFDFTLLMVNLALATMGPGRYALSRKARQSADCDCSCHSDDKRCGPDGKCVPCGNK